MCSGSSYGSSLRRSVLEDVEQLQQRFPTQPGGQLEVRLFYRVALQSFEVLVARHAVPSSLVLKGC